MTLKKKMVVVAAAGALTAAAVPAMAFENEFHGMFLMQGISSNLFYGTTGPVTPGQDILHKNKSYVDQRARLQYIAKASDDLKLVTHFELDGRWGDSSYVSGSRNQGYAAGGDSINLETKNVYLDFNIPGVPVNVKAGLQGWNDAYKGVLLGNDAAGVVATSKMGDGKYSAGWFRLDDRPVSGTLATADAQNIGKYTRDFMFLDGAYNINKDVKVGASYYYYNDDNSVALAAQTANQPYVNGKNAAIHMIGVNASATAGPVTVDGFFLYQNGVLREGADSMHLSSFAANVGISAKAGVGTVKTSLLYASGSDDGVGSNSFITVQNETSNAYMEAGAAPGGANTVLLFRGNNYRTSNTDQAIVEEVGNKGAGLMAAFVGYDGAIEKTFFNVNAAVAADAKKQTAGTYAGKAQFIGTEFNAEVGYKLYDNLKASVQGAYVFLGPKYSSSDSGIAGKYANNPYLGRVILSYNF